ncbi:hypothetical protein LR48_Vigan03g078500 [Vigna angularis]|uniref:Uncharacterized protein n=1 Tax=Phaseolus angularis TaxID=3914 RepID=A0A0L9U3K2_PHAAN|nr:hypothetical protein LR48_Vigan03g078500 [Vigna angularis]
MIVFLASTLPPPKSATAPKPMAPELSTTIASSGDILGATELRGPVNYKYNDLKAGTKNFSAENKLGEGGQLAANYTTSRGGTLKHQPSSSITTPDEVVLCLTQSNPHQSNPHQSRHL